MFNQGYGGYSLSDIAAVTNASGGNNDGLWGGDGAWWIIILFLFCFNGWGGNGFGGNGGSTTREEIAYGFDINGLENSVRGIQQGLCDGFYAMNTGMLNGFSGLGSQIASGFAGVNNAVCELGYQNAQLFNGLENTVQSGNNATQVALMQGFNGVQAGQTALGTQLAQCCCDLRAGLGDIKYQMATDTCAVNTHISNATRDLIDNENANFRAISDRLTAMEISAKDDKIAKLTADNQSLKLAASQAAQNNYLVSQLKEPCPIPAYFVPNPNCCYQPTFYNGCGCN